MPKSVVSGCRHTGGPSPGGGRPFASQIDAKSKAASFESPASESLSPGTELSPGTASGATEPYAGVFRTFEACESPDIAAIKAMTVETTSVRQEPRKSGGRKIIKDILFSRGTFAGCVG